MDDIAEILRRLENLIRFGHVYAVNGNRVRVASGGIETNWIRWITLAAGEDRDWHAPSVEEQVVLLCPGGDPANAVALRGLYSDANPAPSSNPVERLFRFRDGTTISYNTDTHRLLADVMGDAGISTTGDLAALVAGRADIEVTGALVATAASLEATASGAATLTAGTADVTATTITLNGAVVINGPLQLNGPLSAGPGAGDAGGATFTGDIAVNGTLATSGAVAAANITTSGTVTASEVTASGITLTSRAPAS